MAHQFNKSKGTGREAEEAAEHYFIKRKIKYTDVRDDQYYRKIDIDYLTDMGTFEVKRNYHDAEYGRKGLFFWIELELDYKEKSGWWYFTEAEYLFFNSFNGNGIIIKNDSAFKDYVNHKIEFGDHAKYGENRIDIIQDERFNRFIDVKCMRIYMDKIKETDVNITKLVKRKTK